MVSVYHRSRANPRLLRSVTRRRKSRPVGTVAVARNFTRIRRRVNAKVAQGAVVPYVARTPTTQLIRMRYTFSDAQGHNISSTTGQLQDWVYRANDCYDPYAGAGGNQPRNFDQYMAMYRHGVVVKSTCVVNFFYNEGSTTNNAMTLGIRLMDTTTAIGAAAQVDAMEAARVTSCILTPYAGVKRLKFSYTPRSYFGTKDSVDNDDLHFSSGASPTEQALYHIFGWGMNGATQVCRFTGHIDYTVLLLHPITPTQS